MVSLSFLFWILIILFGLIGFMRGWAKELLVTFAIILSMFIISVFENFVPFIRDTFSLKAGTTYFWARSAILLILVFFGYQTPNLPRLSGAGANKFARDRLQDSLLGLFLGMLNGYMVVGSVWFYMHMANYPFADITAPQPNTPLGDAAQRIIPLLPPIFLGPPIIYFAVGIAFAFVIIVFL